MILHPRLRPLVSDPPARARPLRRSLVVWFRPARFFFPLRSPRDLPTISPSRDRAQVPACSLMLIVLTAVSSVFYLQKVTRPPLPPHPPALLPPKGNVVCDPAPSCRPAVSRRCLRQAMQLFGNNQVMRRHTRRDHLRRDLALISPRSRPHLPAISPCDLPAISPSSPRDLAAISGGARLLRHVHALLDLRGRLRLSRVRLHDRLAGKPPPVTSRMTSRDLP